MVALAAFDAGERLPAASTPMPFGTCDTLCPPNAVELIRAPLESNSIMYAPTGDSVATGFLNGMLPCVKLPAT